MEIGDTGKGRQGKAREQKQRVLSRVFISLHTNLMSTEKQAKASGFSCSRVFPKISRLPGPCCPGKATALPVCTWVLYPTYLPSCLGLLGLSGQAPLHLAGGRCRSRPGPGALRRWSSSSAEHSCRSRWWRRRRRSAQGTGSRCARHPARPASRGSTRRWPAPPPPAARPAAAAAATRGAWKR